jgi:inner membrane protein
MASAFTHAAAALALGTAVRAPGPPARFWVVGAVCAALPDVDAVGFWLGVPYASMFGHRGFTHSFVFAALVAAGVALVFDWSRWAISRRALWAYVFLATASHPVLDAMTSGGLGVAFFAPFDGARYFFPWRPILVSPISIRGFFNGRGLAILASELVWVWVPGAVLALIAHRVRASRPSAAL